MLLDSVGVACSAGSACTAGVPRPSHVLLAGDPAVAGAWQRTLESRFRPDVLVFNLAGVDGLPSALAKGPPPRDGAVAHVCRAPR